MSSFLAAPCISNVFQYCHIVAWANIICFFQTLTDRYRNIRTYCLWQWNHISESHSRLSNDSKIHGRATCTL